MPTLISPFARRHLTAVNRSARVGGHLARLVQDARRQFVDAIPDRPGPHQIVALRSHAQSVGFDLSRLLADRTFRLLLAQAEWGHLSAARLVSRRREDVTDYLNLILPAPSREWLTAVVGRAYERIVSAVAVTVGRVGNAILQGVAAGRDRREIAKDITAAFDLTETAARRLARTEGLRIATDTGLAVTEDVPDLVVGYRVNAALDSRTRPDHRKRHGQVYYRNPTGRQLGFDRMPRPPLEADGSTAWNCRCMLEPIIAGE